MDALTIALQVLLVGFMYTVTQVDAACYLEAVPTDEDGGCYTPIGFLAVNESLTDYETCLSCSCGKIAYSCCTFHGPLPRIPDCTPIQLPNCRIEYRDATDPSQICTKVY